MGLPKKSSFLLLAITLLLGGWLRFSGLNLDGGHHLQPDERYISLVLASVNRAGAFGMVQAEAMKYGISVVASDLPEVRMPIGLTGVGWLVTPKDPGVLAEAIIAVCHRPPDKNKISRLARQVFSLSQSLSQYAKIFRTYAIWY